MLTPDAELLKDFAVSTATEDYFYISGGEWQNNFTISGLDKERHISSMRLVAEVPQRNVLLIIRCPG